MSVNPLACQPFALARQPLLQLAGAGMLGIFLDRIGPGWLTRNGLFAWWSMATVLLLAACGVRARYSRAGAACLLLFAIVCIGGSWHRLLWGYFEQNHLARFTAQMSQPVCLEVVALGRLKYRTAPSPNPLRGLPIGPRSEMQVQVTRVRDGRTWRSVTGICRLRVNGQLQDVMAGDKLQLFAQMKRISPAMNPGQYDWARAERAAGRYCELYCPSPSCVTVTVAANSFSVSRWLHKIGQRWERRLINYVPPKQSDLAQALLLGASERLDPRRYENFRRTGTIHLLVVSGLHVGLLAFAIWAIVSCGLLSNRAGLLITAGLVVTYAIIAGSQPPVMRGVVLVVLTLSSYVFGRQVSPVNMLATAALFVLAMNPSELFRSGTQLSFLCVATLATYGTWSSLRKQPLDPLRRLILDARPWYHKTLHWLFSKTLRTMTASLVIWAVVAPLVMYHFQITAPISTLITPLVWPLVAVGLISGLLICNIAWLLPPLASMLGELCAFCLESTEAIVIWASQIELGNTYLPGPSGWWIAVLYAGMTLGVLTLRALPSLRLVVSGLALWGAVGLAVASIESHDEKLRCTFLSVGHGTCVVLEFPGGETMLYDAGSLNSPNRATQTIASFLWSRGITQLDAVVLSHADVDHYNAVPGLLERFEVKTVYVSPFMFSSWPTEGELTAPDFLKQTFDDAEVPLQEIWLNDRLRTTNQGVKVEILHPSGRGVPGQDNANSLVLAIRYAGHSILLPGDLESPGLEAVTAEQPQLFDILLAPHHGSRHSDPPGFAAWCTPKWVVVSGPRANPSQQFTADSYRRVGAKVLYTANVGAVEFVLDEQGVEVSQFRAAQ